MQQDENKKLIQIAVSKALKKFRKDKSNYMLGLEYGISTSLLSHLDRGLKDPQITTIFKLSQAFGIAPHEFVLEIEKTFLKILI